MAIQKKPVAHNQGINTTGTPQNANCQFALAMWNTGEEHQVTEMSSNGRKVSMGTYWRPTEIDDGFQSNIQWSGLAYSRLHDNVIYALEDGTSATTTLYSASATNGTVHARYTLTWGAHATGESGTIGLSGGSDYEELAIGPGYNENGGNDQSSKTYLWLWDGGNNNETVADKFLYGYPEPVAAPSGIWNGSDQTVITTEQVIKLTFPTAAGSSQQNIEAIAQDPATGDFYFIQKFRTGGTRYNGVTSTDYQGQAHLWRVTRTEIEAATVTDGIIELTLSFATHRLGGATPTNIVSSFQNAEGITAMDISSDGLQLIVTTSMDEVALEEQEVRKYIRTSTSEEWWDILADSSRALIFTGSPFSEDKPEALCFVYDSYDYMICGEGSNSLYRYSYVSQFDTETWGDVMEYTPGTGVLDTQHDWGAANGFYAINEDVSFTGNHTIAALIKPDNFAKRTIVGATNDHYIRINEAANATRYKITSNPAWTHGDVSYSTSDYQLVVYRRTGTTVEIFINGVKASQTITLAGTMVVRTIGMKAYDAEVGFGDNYFDGKMGMLAMWDIALTDQEIADLWGTDGDNVFTMFYGDPVITVDSLSSQDGSPELTGTIDDPDATIQITVDGNDYAATNNGDGTWVLSQGTIDPELEGGNYNIVATATNAVGLTGTDSTTDELTIPSASDSVSYIRTESPSIIIGTSQKLRNSIEYQIGTQFPSFECSAIVTTFNGGIYEYLATYEGKTGLVEESDTDLPYMRLRLGKNSAFREFINSISGDLGDVIQEPDVASICWRFQMKYASHLTFCATYDPKLDSDINIISSTDITRWSELIGHSWFNTWINSII